MTFKSLQLGTCFSLVGDGMRLTSNSWVGHSHKGPSHTHLVYLRCQTFIATVPFLLHIVGKSWNRRFLPMSTNWYLVPSNLPCKVKLLVAKKLSPNPMLIHCLHFRLNAPKESLYHISHYVFMISHTLVTCDLFSGEMGKYILHSVLYCFEGNVIKNMLTSNFNSFVHSIKS